MGNQYEGSRAFGSVNIDAHSAFNLAAAAGLDSGVNRSFSAPMSALKRGWNLNLNSHGANESLTGPLKLLSGVGERLSCVDTSVINR